MVPIARRSRDRRSQCDVHIDGGPVERKHEPRDSGREHDQVLLRCDSPTARAA